MGTRGNLEEISPVIAEGVSRTREQPIAISPDRTVRGKGEIPLPGRARGCSLPVSRICLLLIVVLMGGCGGEQPEPTDAGVEAAEAGDFPERLPGGGALHLVRLVHAGDQYGFAPDTVIAAPGDGIRFVHTSYQPESVTFDAAGLDAEARALLAGQDALFGRLLMAPGAAFEVRLEGLAPGEYRFYSRPHLEAGAEGVIRIIPAD